jgi:hypothetical protein
VKARLKASGVRVEDLLRLVGDLQMGNRSIARWEVSALLKLRSETWNEVLVVRILNHNGYPPDLQEAAVQAGLQQAALLCAARA